MLVGTVARLAQNENGNCHVKICIRHAGTNTVNASVKADALSATRKAYGVIRAVGTTVCQEQVILEEIETDLETMY